MGVHPNQIKELLTRQPFQPFVVHLADGREFTVPHPEFAWLPPTGRTLYVEEYEEFVQRIDTMLVSSVSHPATHD